MPKQKLIAEHERLIKALLNPTPAKLRQEATVQGRELKRMKGQKKNACNCG